MAAHPVFSRGAEFDDDRYVYHYTLWERLLDIAHSGRRFGSLASMNDPRESKDWYVGTTSLAGAAPIGRRVWNSLLAYRQLVRIVSLSRDISSIGASPI